MKRLILVALIVFLSGCTTLTISTTQPDGTVCKAQYTSIFKSFDGVSGGVCGASAEAESSTPTVTAEDISRAIGAAVLRGVAAQ